MGFAIFFNVAFTALRVLFYVLGILCMFRYLQKS